MASIMEQVRSHGLADDVLEDMLNAVWTLAFDQLRVTELQGATREQARRAAAAAR